MMGILLQEEALISTRGSSPRGGLDLQEELLQEEEDEKSSLNTSHILCYPLNELGGEYL